MSRFVEGQDRHQVTLLPECLDDYIAENNTGVSEFLCVRRGCLPVEGDKRISS
jgi:hypothetical protein